MTVCNPSFGDDVRMSIRRYDTEMALSIIIMPFSAVSRRSQGIQRNLSTRGHGTRNRYRFEIRKRLVLIHSLLIFRFDKDYSARLFWVDSITSPCNFFSLACHCGKLNVWKLVATLVTNPMLGIDHISVHSLLCIIT